MLWAASRPTASPGSHSERCHFSCSRVRNLEVGRGEGLGADTSHLSVGCPYHPKLGSMELVPLPPLGWYFLTTNPLILKFLLATLECLH